MADAYRVTLDDGGQVFAKTKSSAPPDFFPTEAAGLEWLREASAVAVPEVLAVSGDPPLLVLEWIEPGSADLQTDANLGRELARMHLAGAPSFGREDCRPLGSRRLPSDPKDSWAEFFAGNRLMPLARLASDADALPESAIRGLETVAGRMDELAPPPERPSRLHGDLWGGNRLIGEGGVSWLIDPAAFGGHREFDLAMMRLFGGFGEECYAAYAEVAPLAAGWPERIALHHLAPLTVHAIKFGGPYVGATLEALSAVA